MFLGTGTAGAYHAGVLRALIEAGVRIDMVAGRGVGAVTAMFAAVDAGARLWDATGIWRGHPGPRGLYAWRPVWRIMAGTLVASACVLAVPVAALVVLIAAYPLLLAINLVSPRVGAEAIARWRTWAAWVSGPDVLASLLPRTVTVLVLVAVAAALVLYARGRWREGTPRRGAGALWWRVLGAPFDASAAREWVAHGFWQFMRGAASIPQPASDDMSRRYAEMLAESLGQPGYRELILLAHDLDTRRDLTFALLSDTWRKHFLARAAAGNAGELIDLAGAGRVHVVDALAAGLTPPMMCEPHRLVFAPESYWRGETHRACDRPSAASRVLWEVYEAGATQVIVVSATPAVVTPHALTRPRVSPRERLADTLASDESASVRDALAIMRGAFRALFHIAPEHNPVGAFAFEGIGDERSDRQVALSELVDRGYEDACRQFLEPVIATSGEQMPGTTIVGPTPHG